MRLIAIIIFSLLPYIVWGQRYFAVSFPAAYTSATVRNNFGPPRNISGPMTTSGVFVSYSTKPFFLNFNKRLVMDLGVGYMNAKFKIERPFHYHSSNQLLYYTKHYSYSNLAAVFGLTYLYELRKQYVLNASASCTWMRSFQQQYTPTYAGNLTQKNAQNFNFGLTVGLSAGISKKFERYSIGLNAVANIYSRWRKDSIFEDDPSQYFNPGLSLGAIVLFKYWLKPTNPNSCEKKIISLGYAFY